MLMPVYTLNNNGKVFSFLILSPTLVQKDSAISFLVTVYVYLAEAFVHISKRYAKMSIATLFVII